MPVPSADLPAVWLLVFFLTPIVEMYLLIEVGGYIGAWPTVGLVMITAVIGVALLRVQGLATLTRGVSRLNRGELPAREMVEGLLLAVAGALLLTPGFVTDGVGFLLLAPPTRMLIATRLLAKVQIITPAGPGPGPAPGPFPGRGPRTPGTGADGTVIEGEYEPVAEPGATPERRPGSEKPSSEP